MLGQDGSLHGRFSTGWWLHEDWAETTLEISLRWVRFASTGSSPAFSRGLGWLSIFGPKHRFYSPIHLPRPSATMRTIFDSRPLFLRRKPRRLRHPAGGDTGRRAGTYAALFLNAERRLAALSASAGLALSRWLNSRHRRIPPLYSTARPRAGSCIRHGVDCRGASQYTAKCLSWGRIALRVRRRRASSLLLGTTCSEPGTDWLGAGLGKRLTVRVRFLAAPAHPRRITSTGHRSRLGICWVKPSIEA